MKRGCYRRIQNIIKQAVKDNSIYEEANLFWREYIETILDESAGRFSASQLDQFNESIDIEEIYDVVFDIYYQLRELYPDVAMINGTKMGACEYLSQFVLLQIDQMKTPKEFSDGKGWELRLGIILDYLLGTLSEDSLKGYEASFCQLLASRLLLKGQIGSSLTKDKRLQAIHCAKEWFDAICEIYGNYRSNYMIYKEHLLSLIDEQYAFNMPLSVVEIYNKYWNVLMNFISDLESDKKDRAVEAAKIHFDLTIELITKNQFQESFCTMYSKPGVISSYMKAPAFRRENILGYTAGTYILYKCDDLSNVLYRIFSDMDKNHRDTCPAHQFSNVWFRGLSDAEYHILPSMLVEYTLLDPIVAKKSFLPGLKMEDNLAKFQHIVSLDDNDTANDTLDYISLMQHYGVKSNLLDWSDDVFSSLYFALEEYILNDKHKISDVEGKDAVLYCLDPIMYNKARNEIITNSICQVKGSNCFGSKCTSQCSCDKCKDLRNCVSGTLDDAVGGYIPNISIGYNKDAFSYLTFDRKRSYLNCNAGQNILQDCKFEAPVSLYIPTAILTSRQNKRIRAQSGQFIIYDPFTPPLNLLDSEHKQKYDYVALDVIHKKWLDIDSTHKPFLMKLVIRSSVKRELAKLLMSCGIRPIKYYPEKEKIQYSL